MAKKNGNTNAPTADFASLKVCTELSLPHEQGLSLAIHERASNIITAHAMPALAGAALTMANNIIPHPAIAVFFTKKWKPGRRLKVRFLDNPSNFVRQKIEYFAHLWEQFMSVRFDFNDAADAEIRITCQLGDGSWSYIGTDALGIPVNEPTMNYGWFDDTTPDEEFSRTVLHEFGHALGAIHEHQHPLAKIPWNKPVVYQYYKQTQGWSQADVDVQIFQKYELSQLNVSAYDRTSIMHYPIEKQLLLDPSFAVGWNTELSPQDETFMKKMYP
ncbi:MAG: peptidase M12 [Acidobacteria bacterium]|nr:peptidase M12 [Acidobacteriota bacterium]